MDLNAAVERLVDERVRRLLAEHACPCEREPPTGEKPVLEPGLVRHVWLTTSEATDYVNRLPNYVLAARLLWRPPVHTGCPWS